MPTILRVKSCTSVNTSSGCSDRCFLYHAINSCRNTSKAARFLSSVVPLPSSMGNTCQIAWAHQTFRTPRCRQWSTSIVKLRVGQMLAMPPNSGLRWRVIVSSLHLQNVTVAGTANVSRAPTSGKAAHGSSLSPAKRPKVGTGPARHRPRDPVERLSYRS